MTKHVRWLPLSVLGLFFLLVDTATATFAEIDDDTAGFFLGAVFGQVILLAVWTALAPVSLFTRWGTGLVGTSLVCLTIVAGAVREGGNDIALGIAAGVFAVWIAVQIPLWVLRGRYGWRLAWPNEAKPSDVAQERQFGIRQMLVWTGMVAVVLGIGRTLLGESTDQMGPDFEDALLVGGVFTVYGSLLAWPVVWACFVQEGVGPWLMAAAFCCSAVCCAEGLTVKAFAPSNDAIVMFVLSSIIQFVAATATLLSMRLAGFRMIRVSG